MLKDIIRFGLLSLAGGGLYVSSLFDANAQGFPFAISGSAPIPKVNQSGSPTFDKLRNEAIRKKIPLVIYMTGSSWCVHCNTFTKQYIKTSNFKSATERKFVFWLVDTKQIPGKKPGTIDFQMIPEEAANVVGPVNAKAPYIVLGPPAVFIIDPVSGKLLKTLFTKKAVEAEGKPLPKIIEDTWKAHTKKK